MNTPTRKNFFGYLFAIPIILIALLFVFLFPYALYANAVLLIDSYSASREWSGEPGTVTMLREARVSSSRGGSSKICLGEFMPNSSGSIKEVVVYSPGPCEIGKKVPARFVEGQKNTMFSGYDRDTAWVIDSNDWIQYIPMTVVFSILTLIITLPILVIPILILIKKLRDNSSK